MRDILSVLTGTLAALGMVALFYIVLWLAANFWPDWIKFTFIPREVLRLGQLTWHLDTLPVLLSREITVFGALGLLAVWAWQGLSLAARPQGPGRVGAYRWVWLLVLVCLILAAASVFYWWALAGLVARRFNAAGHIALGAYLIPLPILMMLVGTNLFPVPMLDCAMWPRRWFLAGAEDGKRDDDNG